jgi:hypothetical protein
VLAQADRPAITLTARHRAVDDLIGQEGEGLAIAVRFPAANESDDARFLRALANELNQKSVGRLSYSLEGQWTKKRAISVPGLPALDVAEFEELKISGNLSTTVAKNKVQIQGKRAGLGHSLTLSYVRPNEDFANERFIVSDTITFPWRDGEGVPVTITWANREDLVEGDIVRAHIGVSFNMLRKK